jgi:hypothetical protein
VGPKAGLDGCGKSHPHQDSISRPIIYDNTYTWVYIVVSNLDCNYFPREPTGRDSAVQTFDGNLRVRDIGILSCANMVALRAHIILYIFNFVLV